MGLTGGLLRHLSILSGLFFSLASCSKDTDVLSELVLTNPDQRLTTILIMDDTFNVLPGENGSLDVLANDTITNSQEITITNVTDPENGTVRINEDNTLSYSAPEGDSEVIDTFIYTVETNDTMGQSITETGNVIVTVTDNSLLPHRAKIELKRRFEKGYIAGPGFNDDVTQAISFAEDFLANPGEHRPVFGDTNEEINRKGHSLHTTAIYAYAFDDVKMANAVAEELLAIVNSNDLYSPYWNTSNSIRWDSTNDQLWVQCSKSKKMKDSYDFVRGLQTVLSDSDKNHIEMWFKRFAELAFAGVKGRIDSAFFGAGWDANRFTKKFYTGRVFRNGEGEAIQNQEGDNLFVMAEPQDVYNNRHWDILGYIHSWAVSNNHLEMEEYVRNFFKVFLKYGVFPDGTLWEMRRNSNTNAYAGMGYSWITTGAVVLIAHMDALAGHFPNDLLYDYKTTEGVVKGSTTISDTPYEGTSTTDGITEKSLLTLLKANSNYLRSEANGGWNDIRFYETTPLNSEGTDQPSAIPAMANLYYKDQDLVDLYMYDTTKGYPPKKSISGGYMAGVWDKDSGSWGNMIFGSIWYGQEGNFFD